MNQEFDELNCCEIELYILKGYDINLLSKGKYAFDNKNNSANTLPLPEFSKKLHTPPNKFSVQTVSIYYKNICNEKSFLVAILLRTR